MQNDGFIPVGGRIFIKPDAVEEKTKSGIHLPTVAIDAAKQLQTRGTVLAVGEDACYYATGERWHPCIEPGDIVLTARYAGVLHRLNSGEEIRIINDDDVTAVLKAMR
jgi:chaperonin GroES